MTSIGRELMNEIPVSDQIGSRVSRRRKVVAVFAGYAIFGLASLCIELRSPAVLRIGAGLCLVTATIACGWGLMSLLARTAVNAPNISPRALDERQLARRHEAFSRTQPVLSFAIAACAGYALLAWVMPQLRAPGLMVYLLYGLLIFGTVLPTAYLAWTETDPEPRDDARAGVVH